jgi:putative membrane protein insertion efficiency factor
VAYQIIPASPFLRLPGSPAPRFFIHQSIRINIVLIFLAIFSLFATPVHASSLEGPWGWNKPQQAFRTHADQSSGPLQFMIELHRSYISPIDGKNCPMYPSCSRYSLQCLKKHGLFIGWVMTCDRLLRCGRDELRLSPEIVVNDELRCYDPLENNDFWWWNKR